MTCYRCPNPGCYCWYCWSAAVRLTPRRRMPAARSAAPAARWTRGATTLATTSGKRDATRGRSPSTWWRPGRRAARPGGRGRARTRGATPAAATGAPRRWRPAGGGARLGARCAGGRARVRDPAGSGGLAAWTPSASCCGRAAPRWGRRRPRRRPRSSSRSRRRGCRPGRRGSGRTAVGARGALTVSQALPETRLPPPRGLPPLPRGPSSSRCLYSC